MTEALSDGLNLLTGRAGRWAPEEGAALIVAAAEAGERDGGALAAVLAAAGAGMAQDWTAALDWLRRAGAEDQLAVLQAEADFRGEPLDLVRLAVPGERVWKSQAPRIATFTRFASPQVCAWIRRRAAERMAPAVVNDHTAGQRQHQMRTNTVAGFGLADTDVVISLVRARIAAAAEVETVVLEAPNVLRYEPGQEFAPHVDFVAPGVASFARELAVLGQRQATALLYLNEGYTGGETDFPVARFRYKGGEGDLMLFFNVLPDGRPDQTTVHAGTPPSAGEKWVLSQWIRDRVQPPV